MFCKIGDEDLVEHFNAAYSTQPPLGPPHLWLFPPGNSDAPVETAEGDVLAEPFSPEEVVGQFRRTKRSAPGVDGITYANWRWVDPLGTILAIIFNVCRLNKKVPSAWKHSTVTLIHKGGNVASVRNWRTISLQLNIYKLYSALIAQQIGSWAVQTAAFSPSQKGFLAYDGCAEHNFLLRSMLTDSRRGKRNLALAWLDLREAFRSVHHNLLSLMMERMGLSGPIRENVRDIYRNASVTIRTGRYSYTPSTFQRRGVKQGCHLSPILFNVVLEGLLRHLASCDVGYTLSGCKVNALAYADDICIAASSKDEIQTLLDRCTQYMELAGFAFKFNAKKCGSLCLVNQASPIYVDHLYTPRLGADVIPALSWDE